MHPERPSQETNDEAREQRHALPPPSTGDEAELSAELTKYLRDISPDSTKHLMHSTEEASADVTRADELVKEYEQASAELKSLQDQTIAVEQVVSRAKQSFVETYKACTDLASKIGAETGGNVIAFFLGDAASAKDDSPTKADPALAAMGGQLKTDLRAYVKTYEVVAAMGHDVPPPSAYVLESAGMRLPPPPADVTPVSARIRSLQDALAGIADELERLNEKFPKKN